MLSPVSTADRAKSLTAPWLKSLVLTLLFCCLQSTGSAAITTPTFTVSELFHMNFAVLQQPSSGSQKAVLSDFCGCSPSDISGTAVYLYGTVENGEYLIKCAGCGSTISVSIANASGGNGAVTMSSFTAVYSKQTSCGVGSTVALPATGLAAPVSAGAHLCLGATATYTSAVPLRTPITPTFDIVLSSP